MNIDDDAENEINHPAAYEHDTLWLSDGNVVLATKTYLFRVHKSVLSMRSSVFKDLFALATPEDVDVVEDEVIGISPELYEGIPMVKLEDDGEEIEHLLKAIYEPRYYDIHEGKHSFEKVDALLKLSLKYDFQSIRFDVVRHFSRVYPTVLSEYESIWPTHPLRVISGERNVKTLRVLKSAIEGEIDDLFPALYYACADIPFPTLRQHIPDTPAGWAALDRIVEGRERLAKAGPQIMSTFCAITEQCVIHHLLLSKPYGEVRWERDNGEIFATVSLSDITPYMLTQFFPQRICASCRGTLKDTIEDEREKVWDRLPEYFGLESWKVVRKKLKTWLEDNA